ncbi:type VI secretion system Vgr family protein [Variovorax atrisoli]|uniref:type VI secretion system Vgr family protein n=1 Tax=Variovorax atrisoli TaxID=3394203 RepID=UPI001051F80D|nr:type VI secretion system tip protein TssI/VgrG [Variovorax paradoxus]MDR6521660.1 type VI secretion system secreted protein VgrG [Variovorax paradoxus]
MERVVRAHTPLAEDQLLFRAMHGSETLSELFEFEVELLSPDPSIDARALLGKSMALEMKTAADARFLHGEVTRFARTGREGGTVRHTVYRATVRPWLWYLTRSSHSRTFQGCTAVEMIEEVLGAYGYAYEKKLSGSYRAWDFCAQYEESDFAFVSRLMELEGIYYWFRHDRNQHTLVLADDASAHDELPGYACIDYFASDRAITDDIEVIDDWQVTAEVRSGSYTVDDFNFTTPKADLSGTRVQPLATDNADYDMYEWIGDYGAAGDGEHYARVRLEEAQSLADRSAGHATVRGLAPGYRFNMRGSPRDDDNRDYLLVSVSYDWREGGYATTADAPGGSSFGHGFVVQPADRPFRAPRRTPMPRTSGPQTATVVGPEGEEIWTDEYGRVKVQFHWDRVGQNNQDSSFWVRVSQAWAGDSFGTVHVPRIGQEVIVDFISGRIDRPIVIGRVYNADQMPPFDLPAEDARSGIVSRSTKGGSVANANAIVFEDRMGAEQMLLHAERNLDTEVEGDETHTTEKTRTTLIKGHESSTFESGEERHITAGAVETIDGGETRTVHDGAIETVSGGEIRTITGGATEIISGGEKRVVNDGIFETVNGDVVVTVNGSVLRLVAGSDIRITCSGRVEIINAFDGKLVLGPDNTVVTGTKTVTAPDITYTSTDHKVNTTNFTINTKVTTYNTPRQEVNADNQTWYQRNVKEGTGFQVTATLGSYDLYGFKVLTCGLNSINSGVFVNLSLVNFIDWVWRKENIVIKLKKTKAVEVDVALQETQTGDLNVTE